MAQQQAIRAAGVVLLRDGESGQEFVVVHRPGRQDWSLPKGKIDPGEHVIAAAVRECDEESGYSPLLQAPLPMQTYSVGSRPKVVNYWRSRVREEVGFAPDDEVDEIRWVPVAEAPTILTYPSESRLVELAAALPDTVPLVILRHTQALKRSQFEGTDDAERPLSGKGRSQSRLLVPLLDAFGITTVYSSPARRCHDTVRRFAKATDVPVAAEPRLSEEVFGEDPKAAVKRAAKIARQPEPLVLCSHRPVLPAILDGIAESLGMDVDDNRWRRDWDPKLPPGGFIVVHRRLDADGTMSVVGVERHTLAGAEAP